MFRPDSNRDRTDYSGILMPPDGYRLDRAVGTTYSLDLEALTAVAICLGLSEETDSKLMQNPIGMLNALQKVSDKIVLFVKLDRLKCQQNQLHYLFIRENGSRSCTAKGQTAWEIPGISSENMDISICKR